MNGQYSIVIAIVIETIGSEIDYECDYDNDGAGEDNDDT